MTEAEWLASEDPAAMLDHVMGKISDRKQRLFVEACRATWPWEARRGLPADLDSVELVWALRNWVHHPPEPARAAAILRDLIGNPWQPAALSPGWLTTDVLSLAGAAYAERLDDFTLDPARLAVLSDALEEAGCVGVCPVCDGKRRVKVWDKPPDIETWHKCGYEMPRGCGGSGFATHPLLAALRSPGPHYRGFWAVDLLVGKGVNRVSDA